MDRLTLIRRAQVRVGDIALVSEDAPGADTYIAIYESTVEDLLGRYPWTFSTVTRRLVRLGEKPPRYWPFFYQLPSDMLGAPRAVYGSEECRTPYTRFELTENRLATDAEKIWLRHTKPADPLYWPGYFRELFQTVVMSHLALSVREDASLSDRLFERAFGPPHMMQQGGLYAVAAGMDAQSRPSPTVAEGRNPLVEARI